MRTAAALSVSVFVVVVGVGCRVTKDAYLTRANKLYESGKYEEAALNYRKAVQKDPAFGEAYYRLGLTAIRLGQAREAYQSLLLAYRYLPDNTEVEEQYARVCLGLYLDDPAHPHLLYSNLVQLSDQMLAKNPKSYEGLVVKGYLASTDRKPQEAIDFLRKALAVDGSNAGVVTQLVKELMDDHQFQAGEALAADLIDRQKTPYAPVYDLLYTAYSSAGRNGDAEKVLVAKVNNNPTKATYVLELAAHFNRLHKGAESSAALDRLLNNPKTFPDAELLVGNYYLGLQDYSEADRYYRAGLSSSPDKAKPAYQKGLVVALAGQGKNEEA